MAASKFQFRIFVVGMVIILSSLLAFKPVHAENTNGYYRVFTNTQWELEDITYNPTTDNYTYVYSVVVRAYSNDPTTNAFVSGTYTHPFGSINWGVQVLGQYVEQRVYTTTSNSKVGNPGLGEWHTVSSSGVQTEVVAISDDSIQAIIDSFTDIDETIDTISWTDSSSDILNYYTEIDPLSNPISSSSSVNIGKHIYVRIPYNSLYRGNLIYFDSIVMAANDAKYTNFKIYMRHNNSGKVYEISYANIYNMNNRAVNRIFIDNVYNFGSPYDIYVYYECDLDMYYYPGLLSNPNIYYLPNTDIEYWSLKSFFEQHNYYAHQDNDLDEPNENLSNSVDDYVETEDNLIDGFDTAITDNAVDPLQLPNSNPGNWGTGFTGSLGLIGHVFNMLTASATGGNAIYLLMNFSLMLGLALLIIGKRG